MFVMHQIVIDDALPACSAKTHYTSSSPRSLLSTDITASPADMTSVPGPVLSGYNEGQGRAGRACWIRYQFLPALRWTPWGPSFRFFSRIFGGAEASWGVPIRTLGVPEHPQSDTNPHPWPGYQLF